MKQLDIQQISQNPKYIKLVKERSRFSWMMTSLILIVYYGYILLVAFYKEYLAIPLSHQGVTTWSIPIGIFVICFTIILTGIYVRRANAQYDQLTEEVIQEFQNEK